MRTSQKVVLAIVAFAAPFAFKAGTKIGERAMPKKWHDLYDEKGRLVMTSYSRRAPKIKGLKKRKAERTK